MVDAQLIAAREAAADEGLAAKELAACRAQLKEARAVGARVEGVVRDGLARSVKEELAKQMEDYCEEEVKVTWDILTSPMITGPMERYMSSLGKAKKSKL